MKNFFKLMLLALLVLPFQACSNDDEASVSVVFVPGVGLEIPMEITPNNIAGVWELKSWSNSAEPPVVYLEFIRKDRKYRMYQHFESMYPRLITGTYKIDENTLTGKYDYINEYWSNEYTIELYQNTMVLTVKDDAADRQIYVRVSEVPAEIKDNALSPIAPEE